MNMKVLQLVIPEDLRHEFRVLCTKRRTSMKDALVKFMREQVAKDREK